MIKYSFESHEYCNEDPYVKEIVYFKFFDENESFLVPFFRKATKEGGLYWSPASVGIQKHGKKEYVEGFMLDSRSRHKSLLAFLEERRWEGANIQPAPKPAMQPLKQSASVFEEQMPF